MSSQSSFSFWTSFWEDQGKHREGQSTRYAMRDGSRVGVTLISMLRL